MEILKFRCWRAFHNEINRIHDIFESNGYPKCMIERIVHSFLNKKQSRDLSMQVNKDKSNDNGNDNGIICTVIPYIGVVSEKLKLNLKRIYKKYNVDAKVVLSTNKVKSYFSLKSKSIPLMKSCVVYDLHWQN